jgi:hypothetical protein
MLLEGEAVLRILVCGAVVAGAAALLAFAGPALGIETIWPVLLAVAVGLAAGPPTLGRVGAMVLGASLGWVLLAVRAGFLPQVPSSQALTLVAGLLLLAAVAALSSDVVPLWAGLAGLAAFTGFYEPTYTASPTTFLADSPVALVTVLLAIGIGSAVAAVASTLGAVAGGREHRAPDRVVVERTPVDGGVA